MSQFEYIVVTGNPNEGFNHFGSWDDSEEATRWAETNIEDTWWVASMAIVGAFAEGGE